MRRRLFVGLATIAVAGCGAIEAGRNATTAPTIAAAERPSLTERLASATGLGKDAPPVQPAGEDADWTQAALAALDTEGVILLSTVPADVMQFCPGYASQTRENRAAFWAGLVSAVAQFDGAAQPAGTARLLRISRPVAQENGCGGSMAEGIDNMRCAVRIMARQVGRDGTIAGDSGEGRRGWRGLARSWMPLRSSGTRDQIAGWTRSQSYCR